MNPSQAHSMLHTPRAYALASLGELGAGVRLGGKLTTRTDTGVIWKGRPPVLPDGLAPRTLAIAGVPAPGALGQTVRVEAECSNAFGGRVRRVFDVGGGLASELRCGNYVSVVVRTTSSIPAGMEVFFSWSFDLLGGSPLYQFVSYTTPDVIQVPEGSEYMWAESGGQVTWQMTRQSNTFTQAVGASVKVDVLWGALSCNVNNKLVFQMRGI